MHVDLHLHTTASDGTLSATKLVELAASQGVRTMAITDHDSTEGLAEGFAASKRHPGLRLIPGVELNTEVPGGEVHILGYCLHYQAPAFQQTLSGLRAGRLDRGRRMVDKLAGLGLPISWQRVLELSNGGSVGRPHVAQAMVEVGHVGSIQEAFDRYIAFGGKAYVERARLSPQEAVRLVLSVRGIPVLAHPDEVPGLTEALLPELVAAGLAGMEVYYKRYGPEVRARLLGLAQRHGLLPLGGSDYHGLRRDAEVLPGGADVPQEAAERLLALAKDRGANVVEP
ncbi:MAG: PHP domain-containing protein [Dehalococcoidia bacterium]|nr:PHP domain-containing protein [Dehalococcoidia bacterium]